ncbi:MAG: hypothetical protein ACFFCQ_01040 [Promethearchaeota archaeon]
MSNYRKIIPLALGIITMLLFIAGLIVLFMMSSENFEESKAMAFESMKKNESRSAISLF